MTRCRLAAGTRPGFAGGPALSKAAPVSPRDPGMLPGQLGRQMDSALTPERVTLVGQRVSLWVGSKIWEGVLTAGRAATGTI